MNRANLDFPPILRFSGLATFSRTRSTPAPEKMRQAFGARKFRKSGHFPCNRRESVLKTKHNRRRHGEKRHPEDPIRSAGAALVREAVKSNFAKSADREERKQYSKGSGFPPQELKKEQNKRHGSPQACAYQKHHQRMFYENKLCKCDKCTDATAEGVKNLPKHLQVRDRSNLHTCEICCKVFKEYGALRSHYKGRHTTARSIAESCKATAPIRSDESSDSGYQPANFESDGEGGENAEDRDDPCQWSRL